MSNIDEKYLIRFWYDNSSNYHANSYVVDRTTEDAIFLRTIIKDKTIIIPTLINKDRVSPDKPTYLPIYKLHSYTSLKTKLAVIRNLTRGLYNSHITRLKFGDTVFYYNRGIILTDTLIPLCVAAYKYAVPEKTPFLYKNKVPLLYINPDVFRVSNNLSKLIITSILPTFIELYHNGEVLIRDITEFYIKPTYQDDLGEPLYQQVLLEKVNEIRDAIDKLGTEDYQQILIL